jgi:hypothetical protein
MLCGEQSLLDDGDPRSVYQRRDSAPCRDDQDPSQRPGHRYRDGWILGMKRTSGL